MIDSFVQLLIQWGYEGMFISAFIAGSVLPFASEIVLAALIQLGLNPWGCLIAATLGNTLGGMTCYFIGHLGKLEWIEKYLHVKPEKIAKTQKFLQGKGSFMAFFAFVPIIGSAISVTLGYMRGNVWITCLSMMIGKALRYYLLIQAMQAIV
mgnify:FL=1